LLDGLRGSRPGLRPYGDPVQLGDFNGLSREVLQQPTATAVSLWRLAVLAGKAAKRGPVTPAAMRTIAAFDALRSDLGKPDLSDFFAEVSGLRRDLPGVVAEIPDNRTDPFPAIVDAIRALYPGRVAALEGPIGRRELERLVKDVTGDTAVTAHVVTEIAARWRELKNAGAPETLSELHDRYATQPRVRTKLHERRVPGSVAAQAARAEGAPAARGAGESTFIRHRLGGLGRMFIHTVVGRPVKNKLQKPRVPGFVAAPRARAAEVPAVRNRELAEVRQRILDNGWPRAATLTTDGSVPKDVEKLTVMGVAYDVYGRDRDPGDLADAMTSGSPQWFSGIHALVEVFREEFGDHYRQVEGRVRLDHLAPLLESLAGPAVVDGASARQHLIESLIAAASNVGSPTMAKLAAAMEGHEAVRAGGRW
jgi:hypothetical protein